jgi:hypothetical protein
MSTKPNEKRPNIVVRAVNRATGGRFGASYKPTSNVQIRQAEYEGAFREDYWEALATRVMPGLGLGYTAIPYITMWEKLWGVTPIEDLHKYRELFAEVPFINSAINMHMTMAVSKGFTLEYDGPQTVVDEIQRFLRKHDFEELLKVMISDLLQMGNCYVEVARLWQCTNDDPAHAEIEGWRQDPVTQSWYTERMEGVKYHHDKFPNHELLNPYGVVSRMKFLDPEFMRVRRDAYGTTLGYIQTLTWPFITLFADEVMHLRYMPTSRYYENVYGQSLLRSLLFIQALITEFEKNMGTIMARYINPILIVKAGSTGPGAPELTDDQFTEIVRQFAQRTPGSDVYVRQGYFVNDVNVIQPPLQGLQASVFWLDYLQMQRGFALNLPKILSDPTGLSRSTSETVLNQYFSWIGTMQTSVSHQLEQWLFPEILKSIYAEEAIPLMAEFGVPKIVWKPIMEMKIQDKTALTINKYKAGIIDIDEARRELGYDALTPEKRSEIEGQAMTPGGSLVPIPEERGISPQEKEGPEEMGIVNQRELGNAPEAEPTEGKGEEEDTGVDTVELPVTMQQYMQKLDTYTPLSELKKQMKENLKEQDLRDSIMNTDGEDT